MNSPSHRKSDIVVIVAAVIGSVIAVISITTFVQRRRRRARHRPILTFSTDFREAGPELIVTLFEPHSYEAVQDSRIRAEQRPLVTEEPEAEMVALHRLSSTRLRAEKLTSQQADNPRGPTSNVSRSTFSPTAVAETGGAALPYDTQRLVESLRRENEQLRAERLVSTAPPSYTEGNE
jgi:hypothetical protein